MELDHDRRPVMDHDGTARFRLSKRSLALIIPLVTLLLVSGVWNLHKANESQRSKNEPNWLNVRKRLVLRKKPIALRHAGKRTPSGPPRMHVYSSFIGKSTRLAGLMNKFSAVRRKSESHRQRLTTQPRPSLSLESEVVRKLSRASIPCDNHGG